MIGWLRRRRGQSNVSNASLSAEAIQAVEKFAIDSVIEDHLAIPLGVISGEFADSWVRSHRTKERTDGDNWPVWVKVLSEYQFLFLHSVQRLAFGELGVVKRDRLVDLLLPMVTAKTADGVLSQDATDETTADFRHAFYQSYNARELQYAACDVLIDDRDPFNGLGVLTVFAKSLIAASGMEPTPEILFDATKSGMEAIRRLGLPERVPDVDRRLDEAEKRIEKERGKRASH